MMKYNRYFNRKLRDLKSLIQLILMFAPAIALFLFPVFACIKTNDYWYFMLFFISWLPALIWLFAATKLIEIFTK